MDWDEVRGRCGLLEEGKIVQMGGGEEEQVSRSAWPDMDETRDARWLILGAFRLSPNLLRPSTRIYGNTSDCTFSVR